MGDESSDFSERSVGNRKKSFEDRSATSVQLVILVHDVVGAQGFLRAQMGMDFPVLVNDFAFGIDDKKAGEKSIFEIAVVFERRSGHVDFVSFCGVADGAGFRAGNLNGDLFNHLLDRIAVVMRVGIKGNELVRNIMAKVGMPNRGMCNLAGPDEIIDHVLPIEAFLDPRLN